MGAKLSPKLASGAAIESVAGPRRFASAPWAACRVPPLARPTSRSRGSPAQPLSMYAWLTLLLIKRPASLCPAFLFLGPTEVEVRGWFKRWPWSNIAVVASMIASGDNDRAISIARRIAQASSQDWPRVFEDLRSRKQLSEVVRRLDHLMSVRIASSRNPR